MCASFTQYKKKPSHPILCRSDSEICGVWCLTYQWATLHHQHIASHQLRITAQGPSRHGIGSHPAVIHNPPCRQRSSIARPWVGEKVSWAPCIRTPGAPSGIWRFFWRRQAPLQRRCRLVLLLGVVLLGGDVDVGSWWRLKKWFNSDAFLKGDLTSLGKSVVKIRKMMFYSVFFL